MGDYGKKYYRIREVAEMLDLPVSTLRYWEKNFTVLAPKRNGAGVRLYTPNDIEKIRMIQFLVHDKGLKIEAADEQIMRNHTGVSRRHQAVERLRQVRDNLQSILDALDAMK